MPGVDITGCNGALPSCSLLQLLIVGMSRHKVELFVHLIICSEASDVQRCATLC